MLAKHQQISSPFQWNQKNVLKKQSSHNYLLELGIRPSNYLYKMGFVFYTRRQEPGMWSIYFHWWATAQIASVNKLFTLWDYSRLKLITWFSVYPMASSAGTCTGRFTQEAFLRSPFQDVMLHPKIWAITRAQRWTKGRDQSFAVCPPWYLALETCQTSSIYLFPAQNAHFKRV